MKICGSDRFQVFFVILITEIYADWLLKQSCLTGTQTTCDGWWGQWSLNYCNNNPQPYNGLSYWRYYFGSPMIYDKSFKQTIIFDAFYDNADDSKSTSLEIYTPINGQECIRCNYDKNDLTQQSNRLCSGSDDYAYDINTYIVTKTSSNNYFYFYFYLDNYNLSIYVGIRNIMIYVNQCFPRCYSCSGPFQNQCTNCYFLSQVSGQCNCHPFHQFAMTSIGCLQECPRNTTSNYNQICIQDNRIIPYSSYFDTASVLSASPFTFIQDPAHITSKNLINIDCYYAQPSVGSFQFQEGVKLELPQIDGLKFLRLRITFLTKNLQVNSNIAIISDSIYKSKFTKLSNDYEYYNLINIFTNYPNSTSCDVTVHRFETIFKTSSLNPLLMIYGSLSNSAESWGFFNVTIDAGLCQQNCQVCLDFKRCTQCKTGFLLFQYGCVAKFPVHSQNGVDYVDEYPYSRYLAKGFYNLNMTIDDINTYFDSVTNSDANFKTGQKFSFFPDKFVLGGPMVWYDASYIKTFSITQPHYAISIRFNFTFGDSYPGNFTYLIDSVQQGTFTVPTSGGQNLVGKTDNEITQFFYNFLSSHTSNTLNIEFKCIAPSPQEIRDGFCVISDYFIVVHYCQPFCLECTSATACTLWQTGYSTSICDSNYYLQFDPQTQSYDCKTCHPTTYCFSTILDDGCISCPYVSYSQPPFTYLSGNTYLPCHYMCESCFGPYSNNCLSCNTQKHFILDSNYNCLCSKGYYYDSKYITCNPKCGDKIVAGGEDCDDGNFNPHDGCDLCKFSCQRYCAECILGRCWFCDEGYELIQNQCYPICNDYKQVSEEECEDNNIIPYDGCFNCKYSCPLNCIDCVKGICQKCNEQDGWYLQENNKCLLTCNSVVANSNDICKDFQYQFCINCLTCLKGVCYQCESEYYLIEKPNQCIPKCGDQIITWPEVCDDNNSLIYDGCHKCQLSCHPACITCTSSGCQECDIGWTLTPLNQCQSVCGDGIIMNEECDDAISGNCHFCKFKCQDSCTLCIQGKCKQCNIGWELNKIEEYCYKLSDYTVIKQCDNTQNEQDCYFANQTCQVGCKICLSDQCTQCYEGFAQIQGKCFQVLNNNNSLGLSDNDELIYYEGGFDSHINCPFNCTTCFKGQCLSCGKYYWKVQFSNTCPIKTESINLNKEQFKEQNQDISKQLQANGEFCPINCELCEQGQCLKCTYKTGYGYLDMDSNECKPICGDGLVMIDEECDDQNQILNDGCYNCINQCQISCKVCKFGKCLQCKEGYELKNNQCLSFCGDQVIAGIEDCDDGNQIPTDGCAECKFVCHQQCTTCLNGRCYECQGKGWKLNTVSKNCETTCGDKVVAGNEQCDDGNFDSNDGCTDCHYECQEECDKCNKSECLHCIEGWEVQQNSIRQCEPKCGDSIVISQYEDCDDGNEIPFDGCFQCQYQCQEECTDCRKGVCYECKTLGWDIANHLCYPVCGDKIIVNGYEQCDDGNDEQYDGCHLCFYQCEKLCTSCLEGVCYECNYLGWIEKNYVCIPRCGDGLIKGYEQCDDQNDDENDGCDKCKFKCDDYCIDCQEGICYNCDTGRYILQSNLNRCETECGDGVFVKSVEQCDDGNDIDKDGCDHKCKIETDWICQNTEWKISTCFYASLPEIVLTQTLSQTNNATVVMTFTQQLKRAKLLSGDIIDYIQPTITNMQSGQYEIEKFLNCSVTSTEITDVIVIFNIRFNVSIENPELKVTINSDPLVSQYDAILLSNEANLVLETIQGINDQVKQIALSTQSFNKAVIYILTSISSLCVITGSTDLFWNLLDQLQYLSYIKYINIDFPTNLQIYFEVFKLITVSPAISALKLDYLFSILDGPEEYFVPTSGKFLQDDINGYFYSNFQSTLLFSIGSFLLYLLLKYIHLLMYRINPYQYYPLNFTWSKIYYNVRKKCKLFAKSFFYNGILRLIMSNWYDLSFAVMIQLAQNESKDRVLMINSLLAGVIFIAQIIFQIVIVAKINNIVNRSTFSKQKNFNTLFEDLQVSSNIWVMQYNSILLIKKHLFIFMLVFMQQQGQLQAICIAILQTIFLLYIISNKPLSNKSEYYKCIITEIIVIFNICTFLLYDLNLFSIILGWIHIFTSTMILGVSCIFDLIQQSRILLKKIIKSCTKPVPEQPYERPGEQHFKVLQNFF